ncbi:MAG: 5-bromo-4-chloroindolyl phosphate hydrolysis family protein [Clostridia bacterium]|nr:5-bromo-4-chloroindolyl phosphate hydrolysis family protein [Clostridia bacterium]
MKFNPQKLLKTLDYLPRWAWYLLGFLFAGGPIGLLLVYLVFHVLNKLDQEYRSENTANASASAAQEQQDDQHDIQMRWQQTEASARTAMEQETLYRPLDENATLDDVLNEGRDAMRRIRRANDLIPDPLLSSQIDSIETSCGQILSILQQRAQLLPQLRTFLRYYLPTTLRLLDARAKLELTANTPKAREVRTKISEALGVIAKAFLKQVESLDEYRFIDLESEMDVLRDMMLADGLIDEEEEQSDPFAEVLAQRRGGH